jgi:flavin-dependent dehydrogenase
MASTSVLRPPSSVPSPITHHPSPDVIVVGGGPAGSVTATLLAERGVRVLLCDKARFPRHKACSEYVNAAGARLLRQLGLADALVASGAHAMPAMLIHAPGGGRFLAEFDPDGSGTHALGLSRFRLDALLLDRARQAGVDVREGAHVRDLLRERGRVCGVVATIDGQREVIRAPLTIGADGRHSLVCRALDLASTPRWPRRTGLVAHYRGVRGLDAWGEMHVARHSYAGLAPLEHGLTNVAFVAPSQAIASRVGTIDDFFAQGLAAIPALAAKLQGAERAGAIRGVGPMAHHARHVAGDGVLLVGDAAGFLDPFTGDGIYDALQGALLAAPIATAALHAGDCSAQRLAPYQSAHDETFAARRRLGWLVQGFIANPALMNYATRASSAAQNWPPPSLLP